MDNKLINFTSTDICGLLFFIYLWYFGKMAYGCDTHKSLARDCIEYGCNSLFTI